MGWGNEGGNWMTDNSSRFKRIWDAMKRNALWGRWLWRGIKHWMRRYGFASLVLLGLAGAAYLAAQAKIPDPLPDYALKSEEVYRLEIGAACFIVFYLAAMAFVLALNGKGFAEFGSKGLKTDEVVNNWKADEKQQDAFRSLRKSNQSLRIGLGAVQSAMRSVDEDLESHEERLKKLETQRMKQE